MNVLQRGRLALDTLRSASVSFATKSIPYVWNYMKDNPVWHMVGSFLAFVREGFERNSLIYSAIIYKVRVGT